MISPRKYIKTDTENMVRDAATNAILNTDYSALASYKKERARIIKTESLVKDIEDLKDDLREIKNILQELSVTNKNYK